MPKITIGLMVYNEAGYVRQAIESIQSQSFKDYEIVVGDNVSTDGSSDIIAEIASVDHRVIHRKRPSNIGALQNWNDIVRTATGEYFVLASGHDLWSPNYLENLVIALDNNPDAVLAFAKTQWLDEAGNEINKKTSILDTTGMSRIGRFVSLMFANQHYLYGMTRIKALKRTRLQLEIIGSGEIYLQELAQLGEFILVEGERWYRRQNRENEHSLQRMRRYRRMLFSSKWTRARFNFLPMTQMMICYLLLPFTMNGPSIVQRLTLICTYPVIICRFAKPLVLDVLWLFKR